MKESDIERHVVTYARKNGFWVRKFTTPARRSAPDDIFGKGGKVFWIEFKRTGEKPTELQAKEHAEMREHGLAVYVIDSREAGRDLIDRYNEIIARALAV